MPYRRLPNTDKSRLRAMHIALERAEKDSDIGISVIPFDLQYKLKILLPEFEKALDLYNMSMKRQVESGQEMKENFKIARLYVSHFLQVFNMAIQRNEIKKEEREFFGLDTQSLSLPKIQTEKELLEWGSRVIEGEEKRKAMGLTPITNPRITVVKIYFDKFVESYRYYKKLQEVTHANLQNVAQLRPKVDSLIQSIWNAVEKSFDSLPPDKKREKSSQYGVVYFFRKEEKESI